MCAVVDIKQYTSVKPQSLAKFFTDASRMIIKFILRANLDTNSLVALLFSGLSFTSIL